MSRTIEGYVTDWDDADQVGSYSDLCGGENGDEPIETYVSVGISPDAEDSSRWAVIDQDADGEGPGVVSTHATRDAAWAAAEAYIASR